MSGIETKKNKKTIPVAGEGTSKRCTKAMKPLPAMHQNLVIAPKKKKKITAVPEEQPQKIPLIEQYLHS